MPRSFKRSPLRLPLLLGAVGTLLFGGVTAWTAPAPPPKPPKSRTEVLRRLEKEPGVLINIHSGLFPATWDLTLLGQRATPALRKALMGNTHAKVRWRAAQVLTQLRDPTALPELHQAVTDWNPNVRNQVIRALSNVGNSFSVPHLVKRVQDPQETLSNRIAALHALGQIGDPAAAPALIKAYRQARKPKGDEGDRPTLRRAAISALWALRRALPEATIRAEIRRALSDRDIWVVRRAAIAAGELKDRGALPALYQRLNGPDSMLRNVAAYVIGRIGDPRAIPKLEKAVGQVRSGRLLNNIAFALRRLKAPHLWDHLKRMLNHRQAFIRLNAAYTAGEMRLVKALPILEKHLQDPSMAVRAQAVVALAKIGSPQAVPALEGLLQGKGAEHRRLALKALLYLSGTKAHRDQFLGLSTRQRYRREAALVLAAKGDTRASPLLYPLIRRRRDTTGWRAAQRLKDPLLVQLTQAQLRAALTRNDVLMLPSLLRLLGPARTRSFSKALVGLLFRVWGRLDVAHPSYLRSMLAVIRTLGHSGDANVRRWLGSFVHHKNYHVRMQTRVSLSRLGDTRSLAALVAETVNASDHHRPYLAALLGQLPLGRLRTAFVQARRDPDPYVRLALGAAEFYAGDVTNARLRAALRSSQATLRKRARWYLVRRMTRERYRKIQRLRAGAAAPIARAQVDRILTNYKPVEPVFRPFVPREVVLH